MLKILTYAVLGLGALTWASEASAAGHDCCATAAPSCATPGCTMPAGKEMPGMEMAAVPNSGRAVRTYSYEPGMSTYRAPSRSSSRPGFSATRDAGSKIRGY